MYFVLITGRLNIITGHVPFPVKSVYARTAQMNKKLHVFMSVTVHCTMMNNDENYAAIHNNCSVIAIEARTGSFLLPGYRRKTTLWSGPARPKEGNKWPGQAQASPVMPGSHARPMRL